MVWAPAAAAPAAPITTSVAVIASTRRFMSSLREQRVAFAHGAVGRHLHGLGNRLVARALDANGMATRSQRVIHDRRLADVAAVDEHLAVRIGRDGNGALGRCHWGRRWRGVGGGRVSGGGGGACGWGGGGGGRGGGGRGRPAARPPPQGAGGGGGGGP